MKQTISIRRTETRTLVLEVIQPLARQTLEELFNTSVLQGAPAYQETLAHQVTDWTVIRAEPSCECTVAKPKKKGRG